MQFLRVFFNKNFRDQIFCVLKLEVNVVRELFFFINLLNMIFEIQFNLSNGKMKFFNFICWVLDFSLCSTSSHQRYSIKKVFLKILQNSQESTCTRVFLRHVFCCEFCKVFKNHFFTEDF